MKINTPLAKLMLGALRTGTLDGFILVFKGPVPADADAAVDANNLLGVFTAPGNNSINLGQPAGNVVAKAATDAVYECSGAVASGTATFFRFGPGSDNGQATSDTVGGPRLQGTIGTGAGTQASVDMILADPVFVSGQPKTLKFFTITQPMGL